MNGSRLSLILLTGGIMVSGVFSGLALELEVVKHGDGKYVTVDSLCAYFGMPAVEFPEKESVQVEGRGGLSMTLEMNQRSIYLNGMRAWLSFPIVTSEEHGAVISKLDVDKLILPVMEPVKHMKKREVKGVVIDPGHGGADKGARARTGYTEKEANLDTALFLAELLEKDEIPYVMTRESDVFLPLSQRADLANEYPDYIFISIHYNSAHPAAHGVENFCMTPQGAGSTSAAGRVRRSDHKSYEGNEYDIHNVVLTMCIHREMIQLHSPDGDRGLKRARFVVLRQSEIPSVLVEGGFLSNSLDRVLIEGESYKRKIARAIHNGVRAYMGLSAGQMPQLELGEPEIEEEQSDEPGDLLVESGKGRAERDDPGLLERQERIRHRLEVALRNAVQDEEAEAGEQSMP